MVDSQALRACGKLVRFARTHGDSWLNFVEGDSSVIFRSRKLKGYFSKGRLSRRAEQEWTCKVRDHRGTFKALCHRWDFLPFSLAWSCARIMYARDYKPFANSRDLSALLRYRWTRKGISPKADFVALGLSSETFEVAFSNRDFRLFANAVRLGTRSDFISR